PLLCRVSGERYGDACFPRLPWNPGAGIGASLGQLLAYLSASNRASPRLSARRASLPSPAGAVRGRSHRCCDGHGGVHHGAAEAEEEDGGSECRPARSTWRWD
ncbi:unnamed protein product, partial [Ectocarpus sp. 12 AP-2014]